MRPVIGLIPLYDDEKDSLWMLPGYMEVLKLCGALPIMLPLTTDEAQLKQLAGLCDGLLLTGGHDVSPEVYGQEEIQKGICGCCKRRDDMEIRLLHMFLQEDKPVFGICRGIQFMNAALGGTLYQDLPTQYKSNIEHHMEPPYDREAHKVRILKDTQLYDILKKEEISVNSYHHQAIKDLAKGVLAMALAPDGLVEAIQVLDKKYALAVQWHPEFSYKADNNAVVLIQSFVDACKMDR